MIVRACCRILTIILVAAGSVRAQSSDVDEHDRRAEIGDGLRRHQFSRSRSLVTCAT